MSTQLLARTLAFLTCFAIGSLIQAADPQMHKGTVLSASAGRLVMKDHAGKEQHFAVTEVTKVTVNGKPGKLEDLQETMPVQVTTDEKGKVLAVSTIDKEKIPVLVSTGEAVQPFNPRQNAKHGPELLPPMTEKPILFVDSSSAATTSGLLPGYTSPVMPNIYDHAASLHRMGNDSDLFAEMADLLRTDAPALLQVLKNAHLAGDAPGMQRAAAHTLKGLAANFSAQRAVAAAAEAERLAKAQQSAGMPAAITALDESLDELIAALTPTSETSRSH